MRLERDSATVLVVDVQEAFRPSIDDFEGLTGSISTLLRGAGLLGLPVVATEQYPRGLGPTVWEIARLLRGATMLEKLTLSAAAADGFDLGGRGQVLLCGIEAHICIYQTVADLLDRDLDVHLVVDCVASRDAVNRETAISRIAAMGASLTTVEMALFELLGRAGTDDFKAIQALVR